ncbi:two-component system, chemotaxis family, sensor kinase CheA [Candidatus Magnetomoraceae bacterium gMMP-15]
MMDLSLLPDFIAETGENLEEMETNLLNLEADPNNLEILNDIFRSAHTIKGSAEYLGMKRTAELSHKLENLLELLRNGECSLTKEMMDILIDGKDRIASLMNELENTQTEKTEVIDLIEAVENLSKKSKKQEDSLSTFEIYEDSSEKIAEIPKVDEGPETSDIEAVRQFYANLKAMLYEITSNEAEVNDEKKEHIFEVLDEFIKLSEDIGNNDLIRKLNKIKADARTITYPDDAGDLLADLHTLKELLPYLDEDNTSFDEPDEIIDETIENEEEYDEELFEIFIQHLQEKLSFLNKQIDELSRAEDSSEILDACSESINALKSSANYMDLKDLIELYDKWITDIEDAQFSLGGDISYDFMGEYINEIIKLFPQCKDIIESPDEVKQIEKEVVKGSDKKKIEDLEERKKIQHAEKVSKSSDEQAESIDYEKLSGELLDEFGKLEDDSYDTEPELRTFEGDMEEQLSSYGNTFIEDDLEEKVIKAEKDKSYDAEKQIISEQLKQESPIYQKSVEKTKLPQKLPSQVKASEQAVQKSVRVDAGKIDSLINQAGELVVSRAGFSQLFNEMRDFQLYLQGGIDLDQKNIKKFKGLTFKLSEATTSLTRVANELQEGVMKVRMLPIARLFKRYPRLVHDLTHDIDKEVNLELQGEETELDKILIEKIADPLVHIIRNAVDHGLESVEERLSSGKPESGRLILSAYHESNHVIVEIMDDGRGIDVNRIKSAALEKNLFSHDELDRMSKNELMELIMMPGFSTSSEITRTSGRGVGMDVVKKNIEKLNGSIEINSQTGVGTKMRIKIPLTLAIIKALLVKVGTEIFTIPIASVEETLRIFTDEITLIEGVEVIHLRKTTMSLLRLSEIFNIPSSNPDSNKLFVVVVNTGMNQIGLVVDALIGQEEVVIKPLVDYLQENSGFSGATILGDGRISLILDIYELINLFINRKKMKN